MDPQQQPPEPLAAQPEADQKPPPIRAHRRPDFWLGVAIFVGMNFVLAVLANGFEKASTAIGIVALVLNIGLPIYLARTRRGAALGMLYTFLFLLVVGAICLSVFVLGAICFHGGW